MIRKSFWRTSQTVLKTTAFFALLAFSASYTAAQEMGNAAKSRANANIYDQQNRQIASSSGILYGIEQTKDVTSVYFLEAVVLMNVKADEYVVSLGAAQTGKTALESEQKVDGQIAQLTGSLTGMNVSAADTFVDFISQTPVYDFAATASGKTATERLTGYETKKNIIIRFRDQAMLRQITNAANRAGIFDVIKIDYVVKDIANMRTRMTEEAAKIIKRKEGLFNTLNIKMRPVAVVEDRFRVLSPDQLYRTYSAYESGEAEGFRRVIEARKVNTSYYQPLDPTVFDLSINPIGIEPVVQATLYLKVKYLPSVAPEAAKETAASATPN